MFAASPTPFRHAPPVARNMLSSRAPRADEIRAALQSGQFVAFFQPLVHPPSGQLRRLEATLRWTHPTRGLLAPAEFLCEADQHGLLHQLAQELALQAAGARAVWRGQSPALGNTALSLSLSGAVLRDPAKRALQVIEPPSTVDLSGCDGNRAALIAHVERQRGSAGLAVSGVGTLLHWYLAAELEAELAQGDFICPPVRGRELTAALRRWRANYHVISAELSFHQQH